MHVSCVISTHARPQLLADALTSVAAQTRRPDEVVVVDDVGPTGDPATRSVVDAARVDHGLPVVHVPHPAGSGASSSRNRGAAAATGKVYAFLDDDDTWAPSYLERALEALSDHPDALVVTWVTRFRMLPATPRGHQQVEVAAGRDLLPDLSPAEVVARNPGVLGSNIMLHRDTFAATGGFDASLPVANDLDFFVRILEADIPYAVVSERLVHQRHHTATPRLTDKGDRRSNGLQRYLDKHREQMSGRNRRELQSVVERARFKSARGPARLWHAAKAVALVGPRALRRESRRIHWSRHDAPAAPFELPDPQGTGR